MDYVLKTTDLTKIYAHKPVVNKVNLKLRKGDIYGFIGKNGAGKTTTIRMIVGLARSNGGEIELFGSKDLAKGRAKVGTVIEYPALYPYMTARQNLEVQRKLLGVKEKNKTEEILDIIGLKDTGRKKAKNFSLGMKQRLAIGLALMGDPEFLFLDEPTNGLDPEGIKNIRDLIRKLNKKHNITIMISSHILGELYKIATCYGVINNGELVAQFDADELSKRVKQSMKIKVNNVEKACKILSEKMGISDYSIEGENKIVLSSNFDKQGEINSALSKEDIIVHSINTEGGDYEQYFIDLMGGSKNA